MKDLKSIKFVVTYEWAYSLFNGIERDIFSIMYNYPDKNFCHSMQEIADKINCKKLTVVKAIKKLTEKGFLKCVQGVGVNPNTYQINISKLSEMGIDTKDYYKTKKSIDIQTEKDTDEITAFKEYAESLNVSKEYAEKIIDVMSRKNWKDGQGKTIQRKYGYLKRVLDENLKNGKYDSETNQKRKNTDTDIGDIDIGDIDIYETFFNDFYEYTDESGKEHTAFYDNEKEKFYVYDFENNSRQYVDREKVKHI